MLSPALLVASVRLSEYLETIESVKLTLSSEVLAPMPSEVPPNNEPPSPSKISSALFPARYPSTPTPASPIITAGTA